LGRFVDGRLDEGSDFDREELRNRPKRYIYAPENTTSVFIDITVHTEGLWLWLGIIYAHNDQSYSNADGRS